MQSISDEIREFVKRSYADEHMDPGELLALADRVDRETMPRPRAADGEPVVEGETLYDGDGNEWSVSDLTATFTVVAKDNMAAGGEVAWRTLTHRRPDSFERIAVELDDFKLGRSLEDLRSIADRIRELAKERGDE